WHVELGYFFHLATISFAAGTHLNFAVHSARPKVVSRKTKSQLWRRVLRVQSRFQVMSGPRKSSSRTPLEMQSLRTSSSRSCPGLHSLIVSSYPGLRSR